MDSNPKHTHTRPLLPHLNVQQQSKQQLPPHSHIINNPLINNSNSTKCFQPATLTLTNNTTPPSINRTLTPSTTRISVKPVFSNVKPNTKRGPPASATLFKATKKKVIANDDDDDDINDYDFEENEPSWLDDGDADTVPDEDNV
ncbi:hypothetical protein K457DRAFT_22325 [Linnemannia elongata AG-77]|uniref:Uncharacterized protein n=1 Tax=Linnemannia elongata AG-77 TaxID=1314771 RepID=A0A197JN29_9FUNG|nr:hypothetical protein K457DRAFT_22325 [Linnemannia elongata AG-77]